MGEQDDRNQILSYFKYTSKNTEISLNQIWVLLLVWIWSAVLLSILYFYKKTVIFLNDYHVNNIEKEIMHRALSYNTISYKKIKLNNKAVSIKNESFNSYCASDIFLLSSLS